MEHGHTDPGVVMLGTIARRRRRIPRLTGYGVIGLGTDFFWFLYGRWKEGT